MEETPCRWYVQSEHQQFCEIPDIAFRHPSERWFSANFKQIWEFSNIGKSSEFSRLPLCSTLSSAARRLCWRIQMVCSEVNVGRKLTLSEPAMKHGWLVELAHSPRLNAAPGNRSWMNGTRLVFSLPTNILHAFFSSYTRLSTKVHGTRFVKI